MAKIFLSFFSGVNDPFNKEAIPCFYEGFIKGLQKNGNEVFAYISKEFNKNFDVIPDELLAQIKDFNPDIIFLFNNAFYDISSYFECPILIYEVDSPLFYSNKENLKQNITRYKFIVAQRESVEILKSEFNVLEKNILIAPFFSEVQNEAVEKKQNISFIGTKFITSPELTPYAKFISQNPNENEIRKYKKLLETFMQEPFLSDEKLFDKLNVKSEKIKNNFRTKDIIFYISDYNRTKTLSCVSDLGLKIYGTKGWINNNYNEPYLILNYDKTPIYTIQNNQDIYNSSKIGININHLQAKEGFSWRVCDIMASGACLVSEYKPDLDKYFSKLNLPTFKTPYEARALCKNLLKNENERLDIVGACNEIIDKNFRFKNVKDLIEDFFNISLSGTENSVKFIVDSSVTKPDIKLKYKIYLDIYNKLKENF